MKIAAFVLGLIATSATADVTVTFRDGAPVDTFQITPDDTCLSKNISLTIDLYGSQGALIFDVTGAGQGVEVFQPFVITQGQDLLISASKITDGDEILTLLLANLTAPLAFTLDLDDTIGAREITVTGAEIAGAAVMLTTDTDALSATFDSTGTAVIATPDCS